MPALSLVEDTHLGEITGVAAAPGSIVRLRGPQSTGTVDSIGDVFADEFFADEVDGLVKAFADAVDNFADSVDVFEEVLAVEVDAPTSFAVGTASFSNSSVSLRGTFDRPSSSIENDEDDGDAADSDAATSSTLRFRRDEVGVFKTFLASGESRIRFRTPSTVAGGVLVGVPPGEGR